MRRRSIPCGTGRELHARLLLAQNTKFRSHLRVRALQLVHVRRLAVELLSDHRPILILAAAESQNILCCSQLVKLRLGLVKCPRAILREPLKFLHLVLEQRDLARQNGNLCLLSGDSLGRAPGEIRMFFLQVDVLFS